MQRRLKSIRESFRPISFRAVSLILDHRAVTALEYGLIAALIALAIITGISGIGTNLKPVFQTVASEL